MVNNSSPENQAARNVTQATLYTVLEQFLRLSHPLMPFVTEELWQRLPNISQMTSKQSIMISPYPQEVALWARPDIESDMELLKESIHSARSLRFDYKVANHIKPDFFFRTDSKNVQAIVECQQSDFLTLAKGSSLVFLPSGEEAPKGCCVKVVSDQLSLLVNLTGILDIELEIGRLTKEIERLTPLIDGYRRKMAASDYETKVPENVRLINTEKCSSYEAEMQATIDAKTTYEAML